MNRIYAAVSSARTRSAHLVRTGRAVILRAGDVRAVRAHPADLEDLERSAGVAVEHLAEDLAGLTKAELVAQADARGLQAEGTVTDLRERIAAWDAAANRSAVPPPPAALEGEELAGAVHEILDATGLTEKKQPAEPEKE